MNGFLKIGKRSIKDISHSKSFFLMFLSPSNFQLFVCIVNFFNAFVIVFLEGEHTKKAFDVSLVKGYKFTKLANFSCV